MAPSTGAAAPCCSAGGNVYKETWWDLARDAKVRDQYQAVPRLIQVRASNGFTLYRITLRNAANMHVGVEATDGFTAWGVKIKTPRTARNTDGIDPISSSNITIAHSLHRHRRRQRVP